MSRGQSPHLLCFLLCLQCLSYSWYSKSAPWMNKWINEWMANTPPLPPPAPMGDIANWSQNSFPLGLAKQVCNAFAYVHGRSLSCFRNAERRGKRQEVTGLRALTELSPLTSSPVEAPRGSRHFYNSCQGLDHCWASFNLALTSFLDPGDHLLSWFTPTQGDRQNNISPKQSDCTHVLKSKEACKWPP